MLVLLLGQVILSMFIYINHIFCQFKKSLIVLYWRFWNETRGLLILYFVQQFTAQENQICQDAVFDINIVQSCPTSKEEWNRAAYDKNCTELAQRNNCTPVSERLEYHCVINTFKNETLEVCAPARVIFGNVVILLFCLSNCKVLIYFYEMMYLWTHFIFFRILYRVQCRWGSYSTSYSS